MPNIRAAAPFSLGSQRGCPFPECHSHAAALPALPKSGHPRLVSLGGGPLLGESVYTKRGGMLIRCRSSIPSKYGVPQHILRQIYH